MTVFAGRRRGVYFVFRDQGACATLLAVHVFYVTCPSVVTSLAAFVETPAGPQITSIVQRDGVCVANSVPSDAGSPSYLCKADGSWYFLSGECHCLPGYEPHNDTLRCAGNLPCPPSLHLLLPPPRRLCIRRIVFICNCYSQFSLYCETVDTTPGHKLTVFYITKHCSNVCCRPVDNAADNRVALISFYNQNSWSDEVVVARRLHFSEPAKYWPTLYSIVYVHTGHTHSKSSLIRITALWPLTMISITVVVRHRLARGRVYFKALWRPLENCLLLKCTPCVSPENDKRSAHSSSSFTKFPESA